MTTPTWGAEACRLCVGSRLHDDYYATRFPGERRYLEANVGPNWKIVGQMILCSEHADPDYVDIDAWEPGAQMVPR